MNDLEAKKIKELLQRNNDIIEALSLQLEKVSFENKELQEEKKTNWIVTNSDDLFEMAEVAKVLNYKKYGRNKIFELLRDLDILRYNNQPYQKYVDLNYFKQIEQNYDNGFGEIKINLKTVVTQKGIDFIRRKLDEFTNK